MSSFDYVDFLKKLTTHAGIYKMLDKTDTIIYIGKAKNLKKRVSSYFNKTQVSIKTQVLVKQVTNIEITITPNETEALVLEHNLIKQLKPRYNVVLKDDKSYPYVRVSDDEYPRIHFYRGSKKIKGKLYGPYPSAGAVRQSIQTVQKLFMLRTCENTYFRNRSRPCLQYQIKRCSAPCVGKISASTYQQDIASAALFFQGKQQALIQELGDRMESASEQLEFELAARYRDQINAMQRVLSRQGSHNQSADSDIFALSQDRGVTCIYGVFVRQGQILGSQGFFPRVPANSSEEEILDSFLSQFYLGGRPLPKELITNIAVDGHSIQLIAEQQSKKIKCLSKVKSEKAQWLKLAVSNAIESVSSQLSSKSKIEERFIALQRLLDLTEIPKRIECFDISHTMGEETVASCVVFNRQGPEKSSYRKFNIKGVTAGDDYAAMKQALSRRFDPESSAYAPPPDILVIDGGAGQLSQAEAVLESANVQQTTLLGIVKGEGRKPEYDRLLTIDDTETRDFGEFQAAKFLIQHVRDEAHRFAITGHRNRREKARKRSTLEQIPGIGAKKRQSLITHFGGLGGVKTAGIDDLQRVPGINAKLAQLIYDSFHD